MKKRDWILIFGGICFIVLIIFLSLLLADKFQVRGCGCPKVVSHNFTYFFVILAVFFVASLFYYLFSIKIEQKERLIEKNIEVMNTILNDDEKKIMDKLTRHNGELEQQEISKMLDKIKAHRVIKKLQEKGIIEVKKQGKTNTIKLNEALKKELIK